MSELLPRKLRSAAGHLEKARDRSLMQEAARRIELDKVEELRLKAQLADREARLAAVFHETQLACKVNHGTDYPVGWDDAMACIESICKGGDALDLRPALSLAGWEEDDGTYLDDKLADGKVKIIRRKEADDAGK